MPAPRPVTSRNGPWPLHDAAASRAAEQAALAAAAPHELMARAGFAVARLALALAPTRRRVQIWAGPGNNGGDGLVAARHLHGAGLEVRVALLGDAARLPADAAQALREAQQAGVAIASAVPETELDGIHIDALLGLGASRAPTGAIAAAITALQDARCSMVLAVDIPSGLDPDRGTRLGAAAVRATATLALLTLKPGCHTGDGRDQAGAVWFDDLGVDAGAPTAWLAGAVTPAPRAHATHKGSYGDVAIVGGAAGMTGAAWLAARAAAAAGAGRVYCSPLDPAASLLDATHAELMGRREFWLAGQDRLAATTVACGCGGGDAIRAALPPLLAHARRLVLDADAINAIAADASLQALLRRRADEGLATLLTPHPLEAARLLGASAAEVQQDRLAAAARIAAAFGVAVLLKGSGSIVAAPGRLPVINSSGNAALATAGTGDVLAGWAAGLWAQEPQAHPAAIGAAAAWVHGDAADRWVEAGHAGALRASVLIETMARRGL
ncbi:MAG: NAD(P)H-hydrate dehydratase [Burkholderiales bacterium]|nr:NAD(P)H-hydrate dehydratase [Burkholderiales bacterium]